MSEKTVNEVLSLLQDGASDCEGGSLKSYCEEQRKVAKADLLRIILEALPCASMKLKLSAREKFIWLEAVSDCHSAISNLFGEGKT